MPEPLTKPQPLTALARQQARRRPMGFHAPIVRENASNNPDLALPKGCHADTQRVDDRAETAERLRVRRLVWIRSADRCECCDETERQTAAHSPIAVHALHENGAYTRAKTRGRPPADRFHVAICVRLCDPCHKLMHDGRYRLRPLTASGFEGDYVVESALVSRPTDDDWMEVRFVERTAR